MYNNMTPNDSLIDLPPWTSEQERLLGDWAEKAAGYRWLHEKATKRFKKFNMMFSLPCIIIGTVTGTANFGVSGITPEEVSVDRVTQVIGTINLIGAMIATIQNFLKLAESSESHRVVTLGWSKFYRNISCELALSPSDRSSSIDYIKQCRQDYDRLVEMSPPVPDELIKSFQKAFKTHTDIKMPDICNGIEKTMIYRAPSLNRTATIIAAAAASLKNNIADKDNDDMDEIDLETGSSNKQKEGIDID
jgi:hypothetical protein